MVRSKDLNAAEAAEVRRTSVGVSLRDAVGVSLRDAEAIADTVPEVVSVAPAIELDARRIFTNAGSADATVLGVVPDRAELSALEVAEGRFLNDLDERHHAQVVVLGNEVRRSLFGFGPALGQDVKVDDVWLEVVGVLAPALNNAESFEGVQLGSSSTTLYLPLSTARRKFERSLIAAPVDELVVQLRPGASSRTAAVPDRRTLEPPPRRSRRLRVGRP